MLARAFVSELEMWPLSVETLAAARWKEAGVCPWARWVSSFSGFLALRQQDGGAGADGMTLAVTPLYSPSHSQLAVFPVLLGAV